MDEPALEAFARTGAPSNQIAMRPMAASDCEPCFRYVADPAPWRTGDRVLALANDLPTSTNTDALGRPLVAIARRILKCGQCGPLALDMMPGSDTRRRGKPVRMGRSVRSSSTQAPLMVSRFRRASWPYYA